MPITKTRKGYRSTRGRGGVSGKAESVSPDTHGEQEGMDGEEEMEGEGEGKEKGEGEGKKEQEQEQNQMLKDALKAGGYTKLGDVYVTKDNLATVRANVARGGATLLIGETGTGKTSLISALGRSQGKSVVRVSVNGATGIEEIVGKYLAKDGSTVWTDGLLVQAMRNGDWIVFDEINSALPEILFTLHQLLDHERKVTLAEKDGETVVPHPEFRFFATMNPPEEYAGTKDLNRALLSRFDAVLWVDVVPELIEAYTVAEKGGVAFEEATRLVQLATALREEKKSEKILYYCSTRDLIQSAVLISQKIPPRVAVQSAIVHKMSKEDAEEVRGVLNKIGRERATAKLSIPDMDAITAELKQAQTVNKRLEAVWEEEHKRAVQLGNALDREKIGRAEEVSRLERELKDAREQLSMKVLDLLREKLV